MSVQPGVPAPAEFPALESGGAAAGRTSGAPGEFSAVLKAQVPRLGGTPDVSMTSQAVEELTSAGQARAPVAKALRAATRASERVRAEQTPATNPVGAERRRAAETAKAPTATRPRPHEPSQPQSPIIERTSEVQRHAPGDRLAPAALQARPAQPQRVDPVAAGAGSTPPSRAPIPAKSSTSAEPERAPASRAPVQPVEAQPGGPRPLVPEAEQPVSAPGEDARIQNAAEPARGPVFAAPSVSTRNPGDRAGGAESRAGSVPRPESGGKEPQVAPREPGAASREGRDAEPAPADGEIRVERAGGQGAPVAQGVEGKPAPAREREVAPAKPAQAAPVQAVARGVVGPAKEIPLPRGMRPVTAAPAPKGPQAARTGPAPRTEPAAAQFSRGLSAALRQGGGAVTLRLHPENLGDLKIRLEMEAGKVAAQFRVETAQARQLLDETIGSLRTALEARGLEVQSLSVHVAERTSPAPEARGQPEHSWDQGAGGRGSPEQGGQQNAGGGGGAAHQHGARQRHGAYASGPAGTPPGPLEPIARALGASGGGGLLRLDAVA